jgi:hypothetical protein
MPVEFLNSPGTCPIIAGFPDEAAATFTTSARAVLITTAPLPGAASR